MNRDKLIPWLLLLGGILLFAPSLQGFSFGPKSGKGSWVILVEETAKRSPVMARLTGAQEYWKSLEARGLKRRFYDVDSPDAVGYKDAATKAGIPALIIQAPNGRIVLSKPAPATIELLDDEVKRVTGL